MQKTFFVLAIDLTVLGLAACSNQPAPSAPTKVSVAGGSYTNVAPCS
jgi:hypothetical protein